MPAPVEVHDGGRLFPVNSYRIITCGDVRLDLQDDKLSVQHVVHGWYLDRDVDVDDLKAALDKARELGWG